MHTFGEIKGHARLIAALQTAIRNRQAGHAYIFSGASGSGKTMLAKAFAKTLQCEAGGVEPCGTCLSCRQFDSGNHPDTIYPAPTKTKALGVEDVREQISRAVETKPYSHPYKIFILEEAADMSAAAQNALLKTLEEPPTYAVFLLLTQNIGRLLPTILSRCVMFKLHPLPAGEVAQHLTDALHIDEGSARLASAYAQGCIGRAAEIANSAQFLSLRESIVAMLEGIAQRDLISLFALVKELEGFKNNIGDVLDIAYLWFRDLAAVLTAGEAHLIQTDLRARLLSEAETVTQTSVCAGLEAVWQAKRRLEQNGNFQMVMEVLLLDLQEA